MIIFIFVSLICTLYIVRLLYFRFLYKYYAAVAAYYLIEKKIPIDQYNDYFVIWPFLSIFARFWIWNLRAFMVNQDLYDNVIQYLLETQNGENNKY